MESITLDTNVNYLKSQIFNKGVNNLLFLSNDLLKMMHIRTQNGK